MSDFLHKLIRIDYLIRHNNTGTPLECAGKVGMSERSLYEYIKILKDFGAPIKYNRSKQTYYYENDGRFAIGFIPENILQQEPRQYA